MFRLKLSSLLYCLSVANYGGGDDDDDDNR